MYIVYALALWTVLMILFEYLAELANCKFSLKIIWVAGFFFVCPNNIDRLGVGKSLVIISLYSFYQLDVQRTLKSHKLSLCGLLNNTLVIHTMIINSTTAIASSLFDYLYDNTLQYIHRYQVCIWITFGFLAKETLKRKFIQNLMLFNIFSASFFGGKWINKI